MSAVNVGIAHDDYLVIAELFDIEILADARPRAVITGWSFSFL